MPPLPDVPDVYRITHIQQFQGQEAVNVYYYRDISGVAIPADSVAQGFWDHIKASWRALMPTSSGVTSLRVEVEYLADDHPFGIYSVPVGEQQGLRAAPTDFMPSFCAFQATLNVGTRLTRPGSKRYIGMLEGDQAAGNIIPAIRTLVQDLADDVADTFAPTGSGTNVQAVIVGYPTALQPGLPRVQDVVSALASPYVSHQDSRDNRP